MKSQHELTGPKHQNVCWCPGTRSANQQPSFTISTTCIIGHESYNPYCATALYNRTCAERITRSGVLGLTCYWWVHFLTMRTLHTVRSFTHSRLSQHGFCPWSEHIRCQGICNGRDGQLVTEICFNSFMVLLLLMCFNFNLSMDH